MDNPTREQRLTERPGAKFEQPHMNPIANLIEALGGATRIAAYLSEHYEPVHYKSVSQWKLRQSIPPRYWMAMVEMSKAQKVNGVSYKRLVHLHTPPHLLPRFESAS